MKLFLQLLVAAYLGLCLAVPGVGGEGGENAGGTGVWILPRSSFIVGPIAGSPSPSAGQCFGVDDFAKNIEFVVSEECGEVAAFLVAPGSSVHVPMPVQGRSVILSKDNLRGFAETGVATVDLVIVDDQHRGYRIVLQIDATDRSAVLTLR